MKCELNNKVSLIMKMSISVFFMMGFSSSLTWAQVQLQQGEEIVHTQDGCGQIVKLDYLKPETKKMLIDSISKRTWTGICDDGLALGAGKEITWDTSGKELLLTDQWMLYGRKIGRSTIVTRRDALVPNVNKPWLEVIQWDGEVYSRGVGASNNIQEDTLDHSEVSVGYSLKSGDGVNYTISSSCYNTDKKKSQPCIREGRKSSGLTQHFCKIKECIKMWQGLAGPILQGFDDFESAHSVEIDTAKKSVEPKIAQLLVKREQDTKRKEQRNIQIQQQLRQANQARKPVSSPSLDQLIKQTSAQLGVKK